MEDHIKAELANLYQTIASGYYTDGTVSEVFSTLRPLVPKGTRAKSKISEIGDFLAHRDERNRGYWSKELGNSVRAVAKKGRRAKQQHMPWKATEILAEINDYFSQAGLTIHENHADNFCTLFFPKLVDTKLVLRNQHTVRFGLTYDGSLVHLVAVLSHKSDGLIALPIITATTKIFVRCTEGGSARLKEAPRFGSTYPVKDKSRTRIKFDLVGGCVTAMQESVPLTVSIKGNNDGQDEIVIPGIPYRRLVPVQE